MADAAAAAARSKPRPAPGLAGFWARHAWKPRPDAVAWLLGPLALLYGALAAAHRAAWRWRGATAAPVPVIVVGNLVAGGVGKTPVVVALVAALRAAGWQPGVVSRGHGRGGAAAGSAPRGVAADDDAAAVGDEPLLIRRRTGVPVFVGRQRVQAARALCAAHPEVNVLVADDGLQHHALAHDAALVVFDGRGAGNGWLLPSGPLREPLPAALPSRWQVIYTAASPSTRLPGRCALPQASQAVPLADWWRGDLRAAVPLAALRGRRLLALAGLGAPQKFFDALLAAGLDIEPCPQTDHARYDTLPWPAGTRDVITTEKDAVKLRPAVVGDTALWVVPLDFQLPDDVVAALTARLPR